MYNLGIIASFILIMVLFIITIQSTYYLQYRYNIRKKRRVKFDSEIKIQLSNFFVDNNIDIKAVNNSTVKISPIELCKYVQINNKYNLKNVAFEFEPNNFKLIHIKYCYVFKFFRHTKYSPIYSFNLNLTDFEIYHIRRIRENKLNKLNK